MNSQQQQQSIANEPIDAQLQTKMSIGSCTRNGGGASSTRFKMPLKKRPHQALFSACCSSFASDNGYDGGESDSLTSDKMTDDDDDNKAVVKAKQPNHEVTPISNKKRKYSMNTTTSPITSSLSSSGNEDENGNCKPPESECPGKEPVQRRVRFVSFLTYKDEEEFNSPNLKHNDQEARSSKNMKLNCGDSIISSLTSNDYGPSKVVTQSDESSCVKKIRQAPWYCYVSCFLDYNFILTCILVICNHF